ncbi:MAG: ABC transporter permease [Verrucomicrobia bacterium]|nr:ABC transporter permease [Verrucomicrobiota bacterium]
MSFVTVVVRGLIRRRTRTTLTLLGISIGIAAVVALVGLSRGLNKSWAAGMKARGTDVVVSNMTSSLVPKPFNATVRDRIAHLPHIAATCTLLVDLMSVENTEMIMVSGREWGGFVWGNLKLISGRMPNDPHEKAVVLGRTAAEVLKKKVGDPIQIETAELKVVGIVDGNAWVENGSVILSLPLLQEITGDQDRINVIDVRLTPGTSRAGVQSLCEQINQLVTEARAIVASENLNQSEISRIVGAMSWSTSLLAVLVGVLGVMNTMLMNVFERTPEICVLLALGWKRRRIVELVLWESAILGLLGGIIGVFIGVVGVRLLGATPSIRGLLEPDIGIRLLAVSVAIAILVGVVSGLYPAWRSSRVTPSQALHG